MVNHPIKGTKSLEAWSKSAASSKSSSPKVEQNSLQASPRPRGKASRGMLCRMLFTSKMKTNHSFPTKARRVPKVIEHQKASEVSEATTKAHQVQRRGRNQQASKA
jgi:hypothetical protein